MVDTKCSKFALGLHYLERVGESVGYAAKLTFAGEPFHKKKVDGVLKNLLTEEWCSLKRKHLKKIYFCYVNEVVFR